jgi:ATP-dependent Clp protease ATP-binding subunit ClpX
MSQITNTDRSESKKRDPKDTVYCSFCGKSQHEVRKLIAGPTVFICDECIELCLDIIREERRAAVLDWSKSAGDNVAMLVARAEYEAPGNRPLKTDLALAAVRRHNETSGSTGRISGLFVGPQGCGITQIIAGIWSGTDVPVLSVDAAQLRTTSLFERRNVCRSLLEATDMKLERATRGVVVIGNLDRIAKPGDEFRMIQEELELMIQGVQVPVRSEKAPRQDEPVLFDTSSVSFFACTSTLHSDTLPMTPMAAFSEPKFANSRERISEALVRKGFLPELVGAFDFVSEFGSVTRPELEAYLQAEKSALLVEWRTLVRSIGTDLEHGWAEEIINEVLRQGTGLRGLAGILTTLSIRLAFEFGAENTPAPKVTGQWVRENLGNRL